MISVTSPIVGKGGTVSDVLAYAFPNNDSPPAVRMYLGELFRLCDLVGFDFRILASQSAHETANWTSSWWNERRNPSGIGITGDPTQDAASQTWATGTDAARAHVVHMCAYVHAFGVVSREHPGTPYKQATSDFVGAYMSLDPRFSAVVDAGFAGTVRVLGDLGNGKWATDPDYATQIAAKANAIFKEEPVTEASVTFGLVPKPAVVNKHLDTANPWISLAPQDRQLEAVVWHRMLGTLQGTDGWFRGEHAATAYGIGVAATDGDALAGTIYEWIDPASRYYGESSGPVSAPYGDGLALFNLVGISQVNARSEAIEISGDYDTPLDDKAREAIVALTAWFADRRGIPWTSFPIVPGTTRSFVVWHQEITIGTGKACPGQVVMDETPALIAAVAERLKQYQGGTGTVPIPKPESNVPSVPWDANATGIHKLNDANALAFLGLVTAKKVVPLYANATLKKEFKIGEMQPNEKGVIRGTVISGGKRIALVEHKNGVARARLSDFHERWPTP